MSFPYRVFLDTADLGQIREAVQTGLICGIATNPQKVAASGKTYRQVVSEIREFFDGPIAVQAMGDNTAEIIAHARELHAIDPLLAVKVVANRIGLPAVKQLAAEGVRTNATLIFNPGQALLAGLAGSPFISPFIGRDRMVGHDGVETIRTIRGLYDSLGITNTCIIGASIKDVSQVIDCILAGAHAVAITFSIFEALMDHPLTERGLAGFRDCFETIRATALSQGRKA
jgi:transaldolase